MKVVRFMEAVRSELTSTDVHTHIDGCIGCGQCGMACAWYLATNDQERHPMVRANKFRAIMAKRSGVGKLAQKLGLSKPATVANLKELSDATYHGCTMCGRCTLACPQGISNRRLTQLAKVGLVAADVVPDVVHEIQTNAANTGHSFGMTYESSIGSQVAIAASEGIEIPIDRHGADILLGCSAIGSAKHPAMIRKGAQLLNQVGVSFTMSSRTIDTGTEVITTVGDLKSGREFVHHLVDEAVRLHCKYVLIGECGCDMRTFFVDSGEILAQHDIEVVYLDTMLLQLAHQGRLPLVKLPMKVTYHDPCWAGRLTGYYEEPRQLLRLCVEEVVEMTPNHAEQVCCNGGAGMMRMYPVTDEESNLRRQVSTIKAAQLANAKVEWVITPCTTCNISLGDTIKQYELNMHSAMLAEIVYMAMEAALAAKEEAVVEVMSR